MWRNEDMFMAQSITESLVQACLNSHSVRGYEAFKISNSMKKDRKLSRNIYTEKIPVFLKKSLEVLSTELSGSSLRKTERVFHKVTVDR